MTASKKRGRSQASKEAISRLRRLKERPKDSKIRQIADATGLHWTTVYRLLPEAGHGA